jgi:NADH-quinone oxidoreductase subunit C
MSENLPHRPATAQPMQAIEWDDELSARIRAAFPAAAARSYLQQNFVESPTATVKPLIEFLRNTENFDMLVDLTAVDWWKKDSAADYPRFEIVYQLYSFPTNQRLRVKTRLLENEAAPSIVGIYAAADWLEREVFDMFGILFQGHPALKRILLPEEWQGFPLRKDKSILAMDQNWVRDHLSIESGQ